VARLIAGEKSEKHTPEKKTMLSPMMVLDPNTCRKENCSSFQ
jgi:hypothetical protein